VGAARHAGIDPDNRRRRYRTATVHGNRADAERGLAQLIAEVRAQRAIGATSTLSELLLAAALSADGPAAFGADGSAGFDADGLRQRGGFVSRG
jgi:hypothetical protein